MELFFIKDVLVFSWAQLVAGIFYFAYMFISARLLGVSDYGLFQSLMGIYGILLVFASPLNMATIHSVATSDDRIKPFALGAYLRVALTLGVCCLALVLVSSPYLAKTLHAASISPFFWLAFLLLVSPVLTTFYGGLQGKNLYPFFSIVKIMESLIVLGIGSVILILRPAPSGAVSGYVVSMAALSVFFFTRRGLFDFRKGRYSIRQNLLSLGGPLAIVGTLMFVCNIPVIIARIRLTEEMAGLFGALFPLRNLVLPFAFATAVPLYSRTVSAHSEPRILLKAILFVLLPGSIFLFISAACPEWFFRTLYGKDFLGASRYMMQYGFALVFHMISMVIMFYNAARHKSAYSLLIIPAAIISSLAILPDLSIGKIIMTQIISWTAYLAITSFVTCLFLMTKREGCDVSMKRGGDLRGRGTGA
jgi:O-antigen/teichoic acid export membrane protein